MSVIIAGISFYLLPLLYLYKFSFFLFIIYLAKPGTPVEVTKGFSAKAMYTIGEEPFSKPSELLHLNPFDKKSTTSPAPVLFAMSELGCNLVRVVLKGSILLLSIPQLFPVVFLKSIQAGLNPRYTKGPLEFPLP